MANGFKLASSRAMENFIIQRSPLNSNPPKMNFCLIQILSDSLHRANT